MFPEGRILDFVIVGVLALIVVGPKDLPVLMRRVGRFIAHMRGMAAEFRASFDEMARQSELDELRREVEALRRGQPLTTAMGLGADDGAHTVFEDIHASLRGEQSQVHAAMNAPAPPAFDAPIGAESTPAPAPAGEPVHGALSPASPSLQADT